MSPVTGSRWQDRLERSRSALAEEYRKGFPGIETGEWVEGIESQAVDQARRIEPPADGKSR